ncbi:hypothetical protein [Streptomyces sp. CA-106131]
MTGAGLADEVSGKRNLAVSGPVSDRSVQRATRRKPRTELVLVRPTAY